MVVRFVPNGRDHDRYGIATGRRLGSAVARNRVRRRLREALRRAPNETGHGWDILVVVRPAAVTATFDDIRAAVLRLLGAVRASAGVTT